MTLAHNINKISRTQDVQISHNITFDTMLLAPETLQGLKNAGFYKPSPIQLHGIPLGKCGFDLLLEAKSGTGKTAVFTLIALEKIELTKGLQVIILAPTREIAAQICDVIKQIGSGYEGLSVEVVMGGLPVHEDIEKFKRNVHIVVGSPGRLRHLLEDKHIDASSVRLLVLDEADKLMEKSFQEDVKYIFSLLPTQKQVIMSSATYTETEKLFIENFVQNAQHVRPNSDCVLLGVDQKITLVKYNINIVKQTQNRLQEVLKIFTKLQFKQCLIFCNYQVRVSELHKLLLRAKWPAEQLSGNQEQSDRLDALKTLQEYKCRILIATDLAARGIDASNIDLVINFEPPYEWQTYLHRIGRAGRYGSYGMAITILSEGIEEKKFHKMLEPMRETMKITNLWNNCEINALKGFSPNIDENIETVQINNNEINREFKELWNMLASNEDTENKNILENFENLCASFDESHSDIETFDELLQSFQNDQNHEDADIQYKHINLSSGPCKYIFISLKKHFNLIRKQEEENNNNSKTCSGMQEIINLTENKKINADDFRKNNNVILTSSENENSHLIPNIKNDKCFDSSNITRKFNFSVKNSTEKIYTTQNCKGHVIEKTADDQYINLTNDKNSCNNFIAKKQNNECSTDYADMNSKYNFSKTTTDKNDDTRKALIDAGLPTEFGKSKKNKNLQYVANHGRPKKISFESRNERSYPCGSPDICGDSNNNQKLKSGTNKQTNNNSFNRDFTNNNHKQKLKCESSTKYSEASRSHNISENYVMWYKNLKFQAKQIEFAVYIDELSKL